VRGPPARMSSCFTAAILSQKGSETRTCGPEVRAPSRRTQEAAHPGSRAPPLRISVIGDFAKALRIAIEKPDAIENINGIEYSQLLVTRMALM
jgi:hypothetical protein